MTDNQIIRQIRDGGQSELAWLYKEYRAEFLHWITREFRCSTDDSKDIYQVAVIVLYENVKSGKLEHLASSLKTYLFGIGKNVARDHVRKANRNSPLHQEAWLMDTLIDEPDERPDENLFLIARHVLEKLGQPCRQLIERFYYERKTMEEISAELHYKNADTAKNQKCKCMARLRAMFEKELTTVPVNPLT